jgi:hypothetical protein
MSRAARTRFASLSRGRLAGTLAATAVAAAAFAPVAAAEWGPAQLASASTTQQVDSADAPVISQDGRFVVFEGTYAGESGVWRKRLTDGTLVLVARGASAPSVSADGGRVAFTTTEPLDPADDTNATGDVYVRDMDLGADEPGAYTLASAVDGSATGISYANGAGSRAVQRGALTADGNAVAFTVLSPSNLADGGTATSTPAGQVAVRRIDTQTTTLVSTAFDRETGMQTTAPAPGGVVPSGQDSTAAISSDGSTVAWFSTNIADVTRTVPAEPAALSTRGGAYVEPLWRRIADGPEAPIRRITGGGDPFNPACPPDGRVTPDQVTVAAGANPCDGPFAVLRGGASPNPGTLNAAGVIDAAPQLSADGWSVAFLASVPLHDSTVIPTDAAGTANAYVADMRPGLTRWQALRPLTAWASADFNSGNLLLTAAILSISISPDGTRVALSTARGAFPLSPPVLLDPPLARVGTAELYDVDLVAGTIRRVTHAFDGGQLTFGSGTYAASYSADDRRLAFASGASDVFYGDGNNATDAFTVDWSDPPHGPGPPLGTVSPPPPGVAVRPTWRLGVTASSRRDGRVTLRVVVPGAGSISARAVASVRTVRTVPVRTRRGRRAARAARGRRSAPRVRRVEQVTRRLAATARATAGTAGLVGLPLAPRRSMSRSVRSRAGLRATVDVTFAAADGRRLRTRVPVRFRLVPKRRTAAAKHAGSRAHAHTRGAR